MKIIPIATRKLNVRAMTGPHNCCSCRFALSDERNLLNKEDRNSSKALPALISTQIKMQVNQPHQRRQAIEKKPPRFTQKATSQ
jgi:hypothetical protein